MADEWSKPVKGADGIWRLRENDSDGDLVAVNVNRVEIIEAYDQGGAPRDVVLRLLAAEASDRLGWVWGLVTRGPPRIEHYQWNPELTQQLNGYLIIEMRRFGVLVEWSQDGPEDFVCSRLEAGGGFTEDDLLAALHGKYRLADAVREVGR
jgi:hypothetical protein